MNVQHSRKRRVMRLTNPTDLAIHNKASEALMKDILTLDYRYFPDWIDKARQELIRRGYHG